MFLVGETRAQRNEILEKKAPGKASGDCRESPGDHLLLFLPSDLRLAIGPGRSGLARNPSRAGLGLAQIPGLDQQPAWIWVCSEFILHRITDLNHINPNLTHWVRLEGISGVQLVHVPS